MNIDLITPKNSSFESSGKDLQEITKRFLGNQKLLKLLKYSTADALRKPDLTNQEIQKMMNKNIRVAPKLPYESDQESVIIVSFDNFMTNGNNPEFRDNIILIDVFCPIETWIMDDYMLRPYKIMHEIDGMLNKTKITGILRYCLTSPYSFIRKEDGEPIPSPGILSWYWQQNRPPRWIRPNPEVTASAC